MDQEKHITPEDIGKAFGEAPSEYLASKVQEYNFVYREPTSEERDNWLLTIVKTLLSNQNVTRAGEHRLPQWEAGWGENFANFNKSRKLEDIYPKYHGKYKVLRWLGDFIIPISENFERNSMYVIQDWLFDKYLRQTKSIYEFGCGTGHNLIHAQAVNPGAKIIGLDWAEASGKIIDALRQENILPNSSFMRFDFFNPSPDFKLDPESGIYTMAALEQIGDKYVPFLDMLLREKPKVCIHIEPIGELLDPAKLLDYLSLEYFKMRNYLSGFLDYLRDLEKKGQITIHRAQRTFIGSLYIEGYSVVVWSPRT